MPLWTIKIRLYGVIRRHRWLPAAGTLASAAGFTLALLLHRSALAALGPACLLLTDVVRVGLCHARSWPYGLASIVSSSAQAIRRGLELFGFLAPRSSGCYVGRAGGVRAAALCGGGARPAHGVSRYPSGG